MTERLYYPISEVCSMLDLKPHVLRYWETTFPMLTPRKNRAGNRVYRPDDVRTLQYIKKLLYEDGYTIEGARKKLEENRREHGQMALELEPDRPSDHEPRHDLPGFVAEEIREIIAILRRDPMKVDGGSGQG